uniref:PB1 domain-containing protein n=1 Tax=Setaria italica TaxID=4555 RepID=K3YEP2_SETIT
MAADGRSGVKMVVSYGGEIVRCPYTGKARYAGGENRIVRIGMSERLGELRARLAALARYSGVRIRYALAGPGGDGLDSLHDVADEHDLWVLVTRLCCCNGLAARDGRVRAFLSPVDAPPPLAPDRIRRRASSPLLLDRSNVETAEATLTRSQSAIALYAPAATPVTSQGGDASAAGHVNPGFEALAEIAAAQRSTTGYAASSSLTSSGSGTAPPCGRADGGGFDAPSGIAAAQSSAAEYTASDSGFEALAAVAAEQSGQGSPPPAPVFLVPVPLAAVFFRAIPVYGCFVAAAVL